MQTRVFIIHGYQGSSGRGWKKWLADELAAKGYEVHAPDMPAPDHPLRDEWSGTIADLVEDPRGTDVFVGHSLGTLAILRYLETLRPGTKVGKVILVAAFCEDLQDDEMDEMRTFVEPPPDMDAIRSHCDSFAVIHSEDDDVIPIRFAQNVADRLHVPLEELRGYGHFSSGDGIFELPLLLEKI